MKNNTQRRRRAGLTLVEVMLVLVILMIIASLAVTAYGPIQRKAYINAAKTQIKAFKTPLQAYKLDIGDFPATGDGLEALRDAPTNLRIRTSGAALISTAPCRWTRGQSLPV